MQQFRDHSAAAQAAYSGLIEALLQARVSRCAADLPGGFTTKEVKGATYWYYQVRAPEGPQRQIYLGPDSEVIRRLVSQHKQASPSAKEHLRDLARASTALGCYATIPKHFRVIQRMADHGLFEAGALLVGTHAFLSYQNLLGIQWVAAGATVDLDFAHPGRNLSVAIVPEARSDVRSAIDSLEMGFIPIASGTTFKKPDEPDFDLDFLTSRGRTREEPIWVPELNVHLQPLRFMEFSLRNPVQAVQIGNTGPVLVNLPSPERYAVHKLMICGERPEAQAGKARKDVAQAFGLLSYFAERDPEPLRQAWAEAVASGPAWRKALSSGAKRLVRAHAPGQKLLGYLGVMGLSLERKQSDPDDEEDAPAIARPRDAG